MKLNGSNSQIVSFIVLVIIIVGFLMFHLLNKPVLPWPLIVTNHQSSTPALWTKKNIYISPSEHTQLIATKGKIIFIGSDTPNNVFRVIAFDGNSANAIWQYGNNNEVTLTTFDSTIFIGEVGSVTALNVDTGRAIWSTRLPSTRSVTKVLIRDNILYVDTVSENYFLLEIETGKILESIPYVVDNTWNANLPIWSNHLMDSEFVGNIMYFQKPTRLSAGKVEIVATDELEKNQLWSSSVAIASNVAANSLGIYTLTLDGKLIRLDAMSGNPNELMQFTPSPILRYSAKDGTVVYGYYTAVDLDSRMAYIYFGDSAQLSAYRLPNSP